MGELRKDYILDSWVIIASKRGKRPHEFTEERHEAKSNKDFFARGNEALTPDEIGHLDTDGDGKWDLRWFPNKFAAVTDKGESQVKTDNDFFTFSGNYGYHEILVETPDSTKQLDGFETEELRQVLEVYKQRILELESRPGVGYVNVFKNHGPKAGTSIIHSHSQIIATNKRAPLVEEKLAAIRRYDSCPYCKILEIEKGSLRRCFENEAFVAFAPYASRFNYEVWIFPKEHKGRMEDLDLSLLAGILKQVLEKVHNHNWSYNIAVQYAPKGEDLHFHLMIMPRIATWAGFELGSGIIINSVEPEEAAKFYRGEA